MSANVEFNIKAFAEASGFSALLGSILVSASQVSNQGIAQAFPETLLCQANA